jgi:ABC-type bacteriocin/lantibiotic exporter with double-glycine peptidase domain
MNPGLTLSKPRSWFVPEIVQTSAMDCGPAALKSVLEGFGIPISYGRLREACQTDIDGTSIDTIETVANQLGIKAEQVMLASDHLFDKGLRVLPAVFVVKIASGATHFVVVWRKFGQWLQIMDPAVGRRWVKRGDFLNQVFRHETSVPAAAWMEWIKTDEFQEPMKRQMIEIGATARDRKWLFAAIDDKESWYPAAVLEASLRMVTTICRNGGLKPGPDAVRLLKGMYETTKNSKGDIFTLIPREFWSVTPDPKSLELGERRVMLNGAVLLRLKPADRASRRESQSALPAELATALREPSENPLLNLFLFLRADGFLNPAVLCGSLVIAMTVAMVEMLVFRGLIDIGDMLLLEEQRLSAILALLVFTSIMLSFRLPVALESMRMGRHLEMRLRIALVEKIPKLSDRYFHSRPISDMADRAHSLHHTRVLPGLATHLIQSVFELGLLLAGIAWLDRDSFPMAAVLALVGLAMPTLFQSSLSEADMRVRNYSSVLHGTMLDALIGFIPVRMHNAQSAMRRLHEASLVEWTRGSRKLFRTMLVSDALQQSVVQILAGMIILMYFHKTGEVGGSGLLLAYWVLKLPATARSLTSLIQQYPAQRNILARLMEPLSSSDINSEPISHQSQPAAVGKAKRHMRGAAGISFRHATVTAGGHDILNDISFSISPGEHVALVGPSGSGKSSLLGLLLGWHKASGGEVTVDGQPLNASVIEQLRDHVAWVDPAIQIWNKTFMENVFYSTRRPNLDQLGDTLSKAKLQKVLQKLPEGLQTLLGEGGTSLSGGEGQRLRLARAFAQQNVRIALLDEPFRGLDRTTRGEMLSAARQHWQASTLLCVTHDIAETRTFDRVLVIENGEVIEDGKPVELSTTPSRYRDLLLAEDDALANLWTGKNWRSIHVEDGVVKGSR